MMCLLFAFVSSAAMGPDWHLQLVSSRPFKLSLTSKLHGEGIGSDRIQLLLAVPPRTEEQPDLVATASLTVAGEKVPLRPLLDRSPLERKLLESQRPISGDEWARGIVVDQVFKGTVRRYRLTPGKGPFVGQRLTARERKVYTSSDEAHPWKAAAFEEILHTNRLVWDRQTEDAVQFAQRAYRFTKGYYRYGRPASPDALEVLRDRQGECGDISLTFNAILRANGIPARARVGRWIENGKGTDVAQSVHVRSEFYLDEVGWVPVDATAGMGASEADDGKHFGYNDGVDFLTLHLDPDLSIVEWGSQKPRSLRWIQQVQVLLWGPNVNFDRLKHEERYTRIR